MNKYINRLLVPLVLTALLCPDCSRQTKPIQAGALTIFVSILPQKYFVEKICGEYATVRALIPPGASPHTFEPKPSQMTELAHARLFLSIGVEMEQLWLPKIGALYPKLRIVATDSGIAKSFMEDKTEDHHAHNDHENEFRHDQEGYDPHIWLSPLLVKEQARTIAHVVGAIDTVHRAFYLQRLAAFETEIDSLRAQIAVKLTKCDKRRSFMAFHPSWGYFAHEFSLTQIAIESEGKEPGIKEIGAIADLARQVGITTVFVQPQFSKRTAQRLARHLGGRVVEADPMAEDWAVSLLKVAGALCE
jgi:zinc transport system substrate-binding protein